MVLYKKGTDGAAWNQEGLVCDVGAGKNYQRKSCATQN